MFARVSALILAVPLLVSATVVPRTGRGGQCNTGEMHCCNQVQDSSSPSVRDLAGLLGIDLGAIDGQAGLNCTPISVIGIGGGNCVAQPVCCTGNSFQGLIVVGCTPINI